MVFSEITRMRKLIIPLLLVFMHGALCNTQEESDSACEQRFEKRYFSFENRSKCLITIITTNNRRITLRPNDYEWTGFAIGEEPVTIMARIDYDTVIEETFSRQYADEYKWIIDVYIPILRIVIARQREHY